MKDIVEETKKHLEELLKRSLISFVKIDAEKDPVENIIRFNVHTEEPAILIGKKGEILFALQQIFRLIVRKAQDTDYQVILDVADYRKNQEINARLIAEDVAKRVRETGRSQELAPMPSYKRRAVHTFFIEKEQEFGDLKVYSIGEKENRRIVVEIKR